MAKILDIEEYDKELKKYQKECSHPKEKRTTQTAFGEPWACIQCGYVETGGK